MNTWLFDSKLAKTYNLVIEQDFKVKLLFGIGGKTVSSTLLTIITVFIAILTVFLAVPSAIVNSLDLRERWNKAKSFTPNNNRSIQTKQAESSLLPTFPKQLPNKPYVTKQPQPKNVKPTGREKVPPQPKVSEQKLEVRAEKGVVNRLLLNFHDDSNWPLDLALLIAAIFNGTFIVIFNKAQNWAGLICTTVIAIALLLLMAWRHA